MTSQQLSFGLALLAPHLVAVALISARLLPVAFMCPLLGGSLAPSTVKIALVVALSLSVHLAGGIAPSAQVLDAVTFVALAGKELILGVALGLVASLPFDAARIGGRLVDLFRGSSAEAALPQAGTRESATGDGLYQLLVALACTGATLPMVLGALFRSYGLIKLGAYVSTESGALQLVGLVSTAFATGLAIGAPTAGAALAVDALLGLVSRAVPQLHLQDTGAPLKILAGAAVVWLGIGAVCERLLAEANHVDDAVRALAQWAR